MKIMKDLFATLFIAVFVGIDVGVLCYLSSKGIINDEQVLFFSVFFAISLSYKIGVSVGKEE